MKASWRDSGGGALVIGRAIGRRQLLGSLALGLAWPAIAAGPASGPAGGPSSPALPARLLRVEMRCLSTNSPALAAATLPAREDPRPASGAVVVSSTGPTPQGGSADVTTRSAGAAAASVLAWPGVDVVVANGERARLRWQVERELPPALFAWGVGDTRAPGRPASAAMVGLDLRGPTQLSLRQLDVQPRWPGGAAPVRLAVGAEQPASLDATAPAPGLAVQTVISLPLERWTTVARSVDTADALGAGAAPVALLLQLRVSLVPE